LSKFERVLMHTPEQQLSVPAQVRPHAPQLPTLDDVSTHDPPQQTWVPVHAAPAPQRHAPAAHVSPVRHAGSQGTSSVHPPAKQTRPASHTLPQVPQFEALVCTSTHAPPQHAWPAMHAGPAPHWQVRVVPSQVSPSRHAGSQGGTTHAPASQT
jgi:hypothetical protein